MVVNGKIKKMLSKKIILKIAGCIEISLLSKVLRQEEHNFNILKCKKCKPNPYKS
jgi:hypothetical protein